MHVGTEESICSNCGVNEPFPLSPFLWKRHFSASFRQSKTGPSIFHLTSPSLFLLSSPYPTPNSFQLSFLPPLPMLVSMLMDWAGREGSGRRGRSAHSPAAPLFVLIASSPRGGGGEGTHKRQGRERQTSPPKLTAHSISSIGTEQYNKQRNKQGH